MKTIEIKVMLCVKDDTKYIAQDDDGTWYGFIDQPRYHPDVGEWEGVGFYTIGLYSTIPDEPELTLRKLDK